MHLRYVVLQPHVGVAPQLFDADCSDRIGRVHGAAYLQAALMLFSQRNIDRGSRI